MTDVGGLAALTQAEGEKLERLERVIDDGLVPFKRVGLALLEIRDSRLYRVGHATFEDYCQGRWGFHRAHARRLIEAAKVAVAVAPIGANEPTHESQVRPLTRMRPELVQEAWDKAAEIAGGSRPTAAQVEEAVFYVEAAHPELAEARAARRRNSREALQSSESAEWYSPPEPVEIARVLMGGIDLDPASSPEANETIRATAILTEEDDALTRPWPGRIWLNPPGGVTDENKSRAGLFWARLLEQVDAGVTAEAVGLIFNAATAAQWFWPLWDHPLCFCRGRLRYRRPGGDVPDSPVSNSALVYLGPRPGAFAEAYEPLGRIVMPAGPRSMSRRNA